MSIPSAPGPAPQPPSCYRHPDRPTYVSCTRCNRYICGDCMRSAAVGQQCVDCVREGAAAAPRQYVPTAGPRRRPVVSYALIALSVVMFALQTLVPGTTDDLALWPPAVANGELYRLVTSAFLHYGAMHLLFNMWALYVVGPALESLLGRWRFGALYALSALGGSMVVYLLGPLNTVTAGASGAVFGLFGATFVVARRLRLDVRWVAAVIVINLVFTFSLPGISWQGHVGGLLTGTAVALAYVYAPSHRRRPVETVVTIAVPVLFAALIWWRTVELVAQLGLG